MAARKEQPRSVQALLAGAAVAAFVLILHAAGAFHLLELKTRDIRMKATKPPSAPEGQFDHPEIGIITISDESILWLMEQSKRSWPWPREVFGFMFRACAMGKARAVLFDMVTHIDVDADGTEKEWAKDIQAGPPSFLATPFFKEPNKRLDARKDLDGLLEKYAVSADVDGSVEVPVRFVSVQLPVPVIAETKAGVCDVSTPRDTDDIIRSYQMLSRFRGRYYPSFALAALMVREQVKSVQIRSRVLTVGRLSIPVQKDGS